MLIWISDSNQGSFVVGQDLTQNPIILRYIAPEWATVSVVSGYLPDGLSWTSDNGYITIQGNVSQLIIPGLFDFTFRLTDATVSETLDRNFRIEILSTPIPVWNVPNDLGSYPENYSFNLYPLLLSYDAALDSKVVLLNGQLPSGLSWIANGQEVVITGESDNLQTNSETEFTFRITNPNKNVADCTFYLKLNALAVAPSWFGQQEFLGYIASNSTASFTVTATATGTIPPTYSIVGIVPSGMTINSITGVITYSKSQIFSDQYVYFTVRATLGTTYSDQEFLIIALTVPHIPMWITQTGLIRTPQMQYFELKLHAFDSSQREIVYSLVADADFPFTLDPQGLLYGTAPKVIGNRIWEIFIVATAGSDTNSLELLIEVTQENTLGVLNWRNPTVEYTGILDGTTAAYNVGANSTRTGTVKHGITGGQVPPGLVLDKIQGYLVGYVDYHTQTKDYWFDITATDNVDTLVRTIHMQVSPRYGYQFMDLSLPFHGDARQRWIETNNYMFDDTRMLVNVSIENNQYDFPSLSIIRGLGCATQDPKIILENTMPSIQRMDLSIGPIYYTQSNSQGSQLFYRSILDPQQGADLVAQHQGAPNSIRPNSLENIRRSFLDDCGYANTQNGSGADAFVTIEAEKGSITNIFVTSDGSGYIGTPNLSIVGSGTGAKAHATCKINSVNIVDRATDWILGEQFYIKYGVYDRPARLVVTGIGTLGKLNQIQILDGGVYEKVPFGKVIIQNTAGKIATMSFSMGLEQIVIDSAGQGYYGTTTVNFSGSEQIEPWQQSWQPYLPIALIDSRTANAVIANSQTAIVNSLNGTIWQADYLCMEVQGLYYQGSTKFDNDTISFDGATTCFEETLTPLQTIFDQNDQTLDLMETTFDVGGPVPRDARDNWGLALIDDGTTAFEFYATIFDAATPRRHSSTLVRRYVRLPMPQISGDNVDGTSSVPANK
jgi:hypothetical protein